VARLACEEPAGRSSIQWGRISGLSPVKIILAVHASLVTTSAMVRLWQRRPYDMSWFIRLFGARARVRGFLGRVVGPPGSFGSSGHVPGFGGFLGRACARVRRFSGPGMCQGSEVFWAG
jgi:hypothetical protein